MIFHIVGWVLFFASAVLLTVVVLLQESKGGGLAEAFGGMGAETFGVKTGGINRFTFLLAAIFCGSAILISATW
jgi:protein translocase SecG subunit